MVMSVRMAPPLPLIFLLVIHGVSSADWGVSYSHSHICALKNSSVIMSCNFTYPTGHQIKKVFWTKNPVKVGEEYPDLSKDPEHSQRLQYLGDKQQNCTLRLSHVTQKDSHEYYFSVIADKPDLSSLIKYFTTAEDNVKWIGAPGVSLTVTDLQVESPERVTEGQNVSLTCKSSCALSDRATFIWYRNSQPLTERRDRNNQLLLQSVRREDAGRYSCALQEHTYISPAVQLNVTYPPKSVSVSVNGSGEIVEGDSVTLSCSSDSNPPAEISWFKEKRFLGSGRNYSISNISSNHSGEYKCKSSNEHGWKYSAVTLNVMYPPKNVSVSISSSGEILEGDSVTLSCSSDSNPPAEISWFKGGTFLGSGRNYSISNISSDHRGEYKCKSRNEHGWKYSAVTLNVMYATKNISMSISPSGEIVEGDSVTLSCSSDSNPPAEILWFKEITFLGSGRIYSISKISSDHSGEYKCKSRNKHGWKYSAVTLNVMYPPKNVSVSISPSGEIVEGDSVTLSCSSDSNPPADISWFKGGKFVGSGRNYSISKISSNHSGEYKCMSRNQHGEKYSDIVMLNVMYAPRNAVVSIIGPSGEILEGDSVTLSCSSDSNPPAEISWFKEGRFVGSGRNYSISNISSDHSGEYKCKSRNKHGEKYSDAVTLNVMYAPKNVSVSISPSVEIVEGDSVTLSCSSDSNPPAEISWFKEGTIVGSGSIYSVSKISSNHSGEYKCKSRNRHGEKDSDIVMLNVMYAPRNAVVSIISPSGVIVEGDSVTLNCSSDSNPPAEIIWFKGTMYVGSGRNYSISNISSDHSEEYKCKSINEQGKKYSDAVTLNVMYPPKNVSVSISPSGEILEGDSVTLSCSSDSNPPAEISWFKEGTFVGSGRNYSISNISSGHSGEYKCKSRNKHGEKYSDAVTLNVMYPPKNVSVSISPSGEIVEGDSVTLSCSSDSNPPAEISWFKGGTFVGSGRNYSISKISSNHSGEYKCKSINEHGEKLSDTVMLNVMYASRNAVVSISPSGEIVEGDSVTLSCSSDSNPPAEISWFKERTFLGSGRNYSISNISSDHSGEYKCKSSNKHGEKDSDAVNLNVMYATKTISLSISPSAEMQTDAPKNIAVSISPIVEGESVTHKHGEEYSDAVPLNVMYPPKNVSVYINGSGETEGDSVTLICSSDSNPPALNFIWFKEDQSSSVGSGQSFSALQSGRFYCEAHNQHGSQRSDAVTVTVKEHHGSRWHEVFGITVECGVSFIIVTITIIIIMFIIKKLRSFKSEYITMTQISESSEDTYRLLELNSTTSDLYGTLTTLHPRPPEDSCTTVL
uniref:Ig-like domain-containing protein n=1 Tax=Cyprinus carpio carpio TaxID=630221 RepID=A0A8C1HYQ3_CYPCA